LRDASVLARRTEDGNRRIVAYVVADGSVESRDLRKFLGTKLPDYMVPTKYVMLDRLPLTSNGKVDRRALHEPETCFERAGSTEPSDELERNLVNIWQDVLAVRPVGIRDNFFDLGGHSLLAVRMMAQFEEQLHITLPLFTLFQAPTIAGLADIIRRGVS